MTNQAPTQEVLQGDCLQVLRGLPDAIADAVVADPPYSSGGRHRVDRLGSTGDKLGSMDTVGPKRPDFGGDGRDQRSWRMWAHMWLSECLRVAKPGAYLFVFTDWRQYPTITDAIQIADWVWRGSVVWHKGNSRPPHAGYFRHDCEYVPWATRGALAARGGPYPGQISCTSTAHRKFHQAGKPVDVLAQLLRCCPPGGVVVDPFAGSGTAGVAAAEAGLGYIGIEQVGSNCVLARERIEAARKV